MKVFNESPTFSGFDRRADIPARLRSHDATQAFVASLESACALLASGKVSLTDGSTTNRARTALSELWAHVSVAADEVARKRAARKRAG